MKRQILLWLLQRAMAAQSPAAFTPPPHWRHAVVATVALGTAIGVTLVFTFGVLLQGLFNILLMNGIQPGWALVLTALAAALAATGIALGISAVWRSLLPKPVSGIMPTLENVIENATDAASDFGGLAVDLVRSFISGMEEAKPVRRKRAYINLDTTDGTRATIIPIRRKQR